MDLLTVPRTDTSLGLRRFSVAGPQVRNRLPHELRQCNTISSFKSNIKTHYFRRHMDNSTLSGRASDCVLGRSLRALNKFYNS